MRAYPEIAMTHANLEMVRALMLEALRYSMVRVTVHSSKFQLAFQETEIRGSVWCIQKDSPHTNDAPCTAYCGCVHDRYVDMVAPKTRCCCQCELYWHHPGECQWRVASYGSRPAPLEGTGRIHRHVKCNTARAQVQVTRKDMGVGTWCVVVRGSPLRIST
jgi:hypothetical protein